MLLQTEYSRKKVSAQSAALLVESGDWIDYGMISQIPYLFDEALAERKEELQNVKIRGAMLLKPLATLEADPCSSTFHYHSWHLSGLERKYADQGLCSYIPMNYSSQPKYYRDFLKVDVACITVSQMDRHGYFNFSLTNSAAYAILEKAKTVVVEVNERLPRVYGGEKECIHISQVDYIIEGEHEPFPVLKAAAPTETDSAIAAYICEEIGDGAVLQLGIGGTPNAVGKLIAQSDVKNLGMHTEMLCDAYLDLYKSGKLTNRCKNLNRGKGVWSFCLGSKELYQWAAENPGLASYPVDYTNLPQVIGQQDNMVSINNCLTTDLFGQTCAETAGFRQISGTGGQLDFQYGAFLSKSGKAFLCMASTYVNKETGLLESRIVPSLGAGDVVTDPRSHAYYLVTEQGMVNLAGASLWERAEKVISVAHPDFRQDLISQAEKMGIWRRSNKLK